jgi:hypothetical protein
MKIGQPRPLLPLYRLYQSLLLFDDEWSMTVI